MIILNGRSLFFTAFIFSCLMAFAGPNSDMVVIGPATFISSVPPSESEKTVTVPKFELDVVPVTNARFHEFVQQHPEWQLNHASHLFVDDGYLAHWSADGTPFGEEHAQKPVVRVSWFAASAYCEARGARLPRWYEWELAAAAGYNRADARDDPRWRQQLLNWYSQSSAAEQLPNVGESEANFYGVKDLHGVVWEWVEDYNGLLVGTDNREQGGADQLKFCGAGAVNMEQKENYAVLMRVALLSSLEARYTTRNLGFRCARDLPGDQQ